MVDKVLLIDDDAEDRALFCEALEEIDVRYVCFTAADAKKALSKLDNQEMELPRVIFLDINMPGITGWDCLSKLKEHHLLKSIPVIMYSTSSNMLDIEKAKHHGALAFFTKRYDFRDLKKSLILLFKNLNDGVLSFEIL